MSNFSTIYTYMKTEWKHAGKNYNLEFPVNLEDQ